MDSLLSCFLGDEDDYRPSNGSQNHSSKTLQYVPPVAAVKSGNASHEGSPDPTKKRKKSRWAEPTETRAFIPGMPTIIPANLSREQEKAYLRKLYTTVT